MAIQVQEILTSEFFTELLNRFNTDGRTDIYQALSDYAGEFSMLSLVSYEGLCALDIFESRLQTTSSRVSYVYLNIMHSFPKIFDSLVADYNPLENFFTDREMSDSLDSDSTRTGGYTDTPSGSKTRSFTNYGNTGMGTTFESFGDNDFRNISKTKADGTINDGFINYQEQRVFNSLKDEGNADRSVEEHKSGNSGIFSKQDLTKREIELRLHYRLIPIFIRMCVDCINKGVWADED